MEICVFDKRISPRMVHRGWWHGGRRPTFVQTDSLLERPEIRRVPVVPRSVSIEPVRAGRIEAVVYGGGEKIRLPVATAEDTMLMKLVWFRRGGEVSERQLNDVKGIVSVQRER